MEKEKRAIYKKWWFWLIIVVVIIGIAGGTEDTTNTASTNNNNNKTEVIVVDFSTMDKNSVEEWCTTNNIICNVTEEYSNTVEKGAFVRQSTNANEKVYEGSKITIVYSLGKEPSTEYKNALKKAESYSKLMHMSKQGIYDQLTSEYGEQFSADAAQYAIDSIQADWNANALAKARSYQNTMNMSKNAIYDQLISEYGEKFTAEEAQYAIDNLE